MRLRAHGSTVLCIALSFLAACLVAAFGATHATAAASTGGVQASVPTRGSHSSAASRPAAMIHRHTAPITSRSANLLYAGPVYERTASGQIVPYQSPAAQAQAQAQMQTATGGSTVGILTGAAKPQLLVPGHMARMVNGLAAAPMLAPALIQQMIWAANQIIGLPYIYGGGHASFSSPGYDCSGTVSFALHGASLIQMPEDSSEFMHWGSHGVGAWVTVFSNPGHAYMTVAGLRLDTSAADDPSSQQGPRWRPLRPANAGFTVRHPVGL